MDDDFWLKFIKTGLNSLKTSFSLFKSRISPIMEFIFDSKSSKLNKFGLVGGFNE